MLSVQVNSMINVEKHITLIVSETTKYILRAANPWAADRPAWGWPPEERIDMTP
jgi:hypothetical protein